MGDNNVEDRGVLFERVREASLSPKNRLFLKHACGNLVLRIAVIEVSSASCRVCICHR